METIVDPASTPFTLAYQFLLTTAETAGAFDFYTLSVQLALMLIGLLISALFSASEVAFFSMVNQMDSLDRDQKPGGQDAYIIRMLEKPRRLLATILICNTFANILSSVLAAVISGDIAAYFGFPPAIVFAVEIVVITFMILILSEITPKILAINNPLKMTRKLSGFIYAFFVLLTPITKLIADSTMSMERFLPKPTNRMTTEDLRTMAQVSEKEGSIRGDEREIIENIIEFGNINVREIMTSRVNMVAVSVEYSLVDVIKIIQEKGLSRMPLFENDLDNILGVIYTKDVLPYINSKVEDTSVNWKTIARKALFIPATKKLDDLLRDFQHEKTHMAIVVDEYGGTEGVITLDDILEEIVGDIGDEYDENEEKLYTEFKNGVFIFDAKIDLDDLDEILETQLSSSDDEFETLGGLVYHLMERIPNVGERMTYKGLELTVHSTKNNRVKKLRVKKSPVKVKGETGSKHV